MPYPRGQPRPATDPGGSSSGSSTRGRGRGGRRRGRRGRGRGGKPAPKMVRTETGKRVKLTKGMAKHLQEAKDAKRDAKRKLRTKQKKAANPVAPDENADHFYLPVELAETLARLRMADQIASQKVRSSRVTGKPYFREIFDRLKQFGIIADTVTRRAMDDALRDLVVSLDTSLEDCYQIVLDYLFCNADSLPFAVAGAVSHTRKVTKTGAAEMLSFFDSEGFEQDYFTDVELSQVSGSKWLASLLLAPPYDPIPVERSDEELLSEIEMVSLCCPNVTVLSNTHLDVHLSLGDEQQYRIRMEIDLSHSNYPYDLPTFVFHSSTVPKGILRSLHVQLLSTCVSMLGAPVLATLLGMVTVSALEEAGLTIRGQKDEDQAATPTVKTTLPQDGALQMDQAVLDLVPLLEEVSISTEKSKLASERRRPHHRVSRIVDEPSNKRIAARERFVDCQSRATAILSEVSTLPVFAHKEPLLASLESQVVVVSGETGSGKSTLIPFFLMEDSLMNGLPCSIVCTQPRRIAAMSVAERVSSICGCKLGDMVGYSVRLDNRTNTNTRLTFCTVGILLRRLLEDPQLRSVSHVVIDEVHERSIDSDFLIVLMKRLLIERPDLKLILMSATLEADKFSAYFDGCPQFAISGRTYPVESFYLEDLLDWTEFEVATAGSVVDWERQDAVDADDIMAEYHQAEELAELYPNCCEETRANLLKWPSELSSIHYDLIEELVARICANEEPAPDAEPIDGGVLVFLPGLAEIRSCMTVLQGSPRVAPFCEVLPLHSSFDPKDQAKIFKPVRGKRKIVLATNIAESSVTVPDIVFVIDTGFHKELKYDLTTATPRLACSRVSKANSSQRQGRGGRVRNGFYFLLLTSHDYNRLARFQQPEMKRVPLESLVLQVKVLGLGNAAHFLMEALDPPTGRHLGTSLSALVDIGAIRNAMLWTEPLQGGRKRITTLEKLGDGDITPLGRILAQLPVNPRIGKLLIYSCLFRCVDFGLVVAAALESRDPFANPAHVGGRAKVEKARKKFSLGFSDHIGIYNAVRAYRANLVTREMGSRLFADQNCLSIVQIQNIDEIARQLYDLMVDIGMIKRFTNTRRKRMSEPFGSPSDNVFSDSMGVTKGVLVAGLFPNVARRVRDPSAKHAWVLKGGAKGFIHPGSTLFHNPGLVDYNHVVFHEKILTSKLYMRDVSAVSPYAILLVAASDLIVDHKHGLISLSSAPELKFKANDPAVVVLLRSLKNLIDQLFEALVATKDVDSVFGENTAGETVIGVASRVLEASFHHPGRQ